MIKEFMDKVDAQIDAHFKALTVANEKATKEMMDDINQRFSNGTMGLIVEPPSEEAIKKAMQLWEDSAPPIPKSELYLQIPQNTSIMTQEILLSKSKAIVEQLDGLTYNEANSVLDTAFRAVKHRSERIIPITFEGDSINECLSVALKNRQLNEKGCLVEEVNTKKS